MAVGGTTLSLNNNDTISNETAWSKGSDSWNPALGTGGGTSQYETEPAYQDGVQRTGYRTMPDVAFVADPATGVAIYDSYNNGPSTPWAQIGGTSLSAPCWAGLIAITNQGLAANGVPALGSPNVLSALYKDYQQHSGDFHDITSGSNGGYSAGPGYDEVTGLGSPVANKLIPDLVTGLVAAYPFTASLNSSGNLIIADGVSGSASDNLTIQADTANHRYVIQDPDNQFDIIGTLQAAASKPNTNTVYVPFSAVTGGSIIVNSQEAQENLTVDYSLGSFAAQGKNIQVDASYVGTTFLDVTGTGAVSQETFNLTGSGSGSVQVTNANAASTIDYINVTQVYSTITATNVTVTANIPSGDEAVFADNLTGNFAGIYSSVTQSYYVAFAYPTNSIQFNGTSGCNEVLVAGTDAISQETFDLTSAEGGDVQLTNSNSTLTIDYANVILVDSTINPTNVTVTANLVTSDEAVFADNLTGNFAGIFSQLTSSYYVEIAYPTNSIQFTGTSGCNQVQIAGTGAISQETFDLASAESGDVQLTNANSTLTIDYINVTLVNSTINPTNVTATANLPTNDEAFFADYVSGNLAGIFSSATNSFYVQFDYPTNLIHFNGTSGCNEVIAVGTGTISQETFDFTGPASGDVQLANANSTLKIDYVDVSQVQSVVVVPNVTLNLPTGAQASLEDDGDPTNGISGITSPSSNFPTTLFANPANTLTVNTAGGHSLVRLESMDNSFAPAKENYNAQPGDTFQLDEPGAMLDSSGNLIIADDGDVTLQADTANSRYVINDPGNQLSLVGNLLVSGNTPNNNTVYVPFSAVTGGNIIVNALAATETLTVDYSLGYFAAQGKTIQFYGQLGGTNVLNVAGAGIFSQVAFDLTSNSGGDVQVTDPDGMSKIDYTNVNAVNSTIAAFNVETNLPAGAIASLQDDGNPTNGISEVTSLNGSFATATFANPPNALTVITNGGNSNLMNSILDLAAMDNGFAPVTENFLTQFGDSFNVFGTPANKVCFAPGGWLYFVDTTTGYLDMANQHSGAITVLYMPPTSTSVDVSSMDINPNQIAVDTDVTHPTQPATAPGGVGVYFLVNTIITTADLEEVIIVGELAKFQNGAVAFLGFNYIPGVSNVGYFQIAYDAAYDTLVFVDQDGNLGIYPDVGPAATIVGPGVEDFSGNPGPYISRFVIDPNTGFGYLETSDNKIAQFTPAVGLSLAGSSTSYDSIKTQPSNMTALVGLTATFTAASAFPSDQVQWYVSSDRGATFTPLSDSEQYSGTNSDTLTIGGLTDSQNNYRYEAVFTNSLLGDSSGSLTSNAAILSVNPGLFYVNTGLSAGDRFTTAPGSTTNDGITPGTPLESVQEVLDTYTMEPGYMILVDAGTYADGFTLTAADAGIGIAGAGNQMSVIDGAVSVQGANGIAVYGLSFAGGVTVEDNDPQADQSDFFSVNPSAQGVEFNIGSSTQAANDGYLAGLVGALTIVGGSGSGNRLVVNDSANTTTADTVQVTGNAITFTGGATAAINYSAEAGGSFTNGASNDGVLILGPAMGSTFNVQGTLAGNTTEIYGGPGNNTYNVTNGGMTGGAAPLGIAGLLYIDDQGGNANRLIVDNSGGTADQTVTVTADSITGIAAGIIDFASTGQFTDSTTQANDGILIKGASGAGVTGSTFNVQGTLAGSTTEIDGGSGNDTYNVTNGGMTAGTAPLGIAGMLFINDQGGSANRLIVDNSGGTANQTVTVTANSITGIATGTIDYASTGQFTDPTTQADDGILIKGANGGGVTGNTFDVQGTLGGSTTQIEGDATNDTFIVSSDAGVQNTPAGDLNGIEGDLTVVGGRGSANQLIVGDVGNSLLDKSNVVLTTTTIAGTTYQQIQNFAGSSASSNINYTAAGSFNDVVGGVDQGDGILLLGSSIGANTFNVQSTPSGSTTEIAPGDGADSVIVSSNADVFGTPTSIPTGILDNIAGNLTISAGSGLANRLIVSDLGQTATVKTNVIQTTASVGSTTYEQIQNFAGTGAVINYTAAGGFNDGAPGVGPGQGILLVSSSTLATTFNVRSTLADSTTAIEGGSVSNLFTVSSDAGIGDSGVLSAVLGPLSIDAGSGTANRLVISNFGSTQPQSVLLTAASNGYAAIEQMAPVPIYYKATGGGFYPLGAGNSIPGYDPNFGIILRGSQAASNQFAIQSTPANATTQIQGDATNDTFIVSSDAGAEHARRRPQRHRGRPHHGRRQRDRQPAHRRRCGRHVRGQIQRRVNHCDHWRHDLSTDSELRGKQHNPQHQLHRRGCL